MAASLLLPQISNMKAMTAESITLDEFLALPEDGYRHEVSRGRLLREPPPGYIHGRVCAKIVMRLGDFLKTHPIGEVQTQSGVLLSLDPLTVRGPDVALIRNERLARDVADPYFHGAPDLAIEVVSPANRAADLLEKFAQYFGSGAETVWVVYPDSRSVAVHHADGTLQLVQGQELVRYGEFAVAAEDLFA